MNLNKKSKEIIVGLVFLGILVFVGLNSCLYSARIDVTKNKMFSISDVSRNLFRDIRDQVHITYYLTDKLNTTSTIYRQIEDILREYVAYSNGKIKLDVVDPVRDNKVAEAEEFQIRQFQGGLQRSEDEANVFIAYSGLVMEYLDRKRIVPQIQQVETLEYDLTSNIRSMVADRVKKIGFLLDKEDANFSEFSMVTAALQSSYEVADIQKGQEIPSSLDALFVIGGANLSAYELYPIDQYLMRGGRVMFSTDAVKINAQYMMAFPVPEAPLIQALKTYGAAPEPQLIMEFRKASLYIDQGTNYPYFINTFQEFASKENPITERFAPVYFFWASPLALTPSSAVKIEALIRTTPEAVRAKDDFRISPKEASSMYEIMALSGPKESLPVAAALSGTFTSYFKDKEVPKDKTAKKEWPKAETQSPATRLLVIGDGDWLAPDYLTRTPNNFGFFINCLSWLASDDDLLSIRTRQQHDPSMLKIKDPGEAATAKIIITVLNLVVVPLIVVGVGIIIYILRRKKKTA